MQLSKDLLTAEQGTAITRLYEADQTLLVAPTGAGKTVICATAISELLADGVLSSVVIAAPPKVIERLDAEVGKWSHLRDMKLTILTGSPEQRLAKLKDPSQVWAVSLQNLDWLLQQKFQFDGIVIDELSTAAGKQTARLRRKQFDGVRWRVGMTATPVSQNFEKLFAMARLLDGGVALGTNKQKYLDTYFTSDYMGHNYEIREGAAEDILKRIKPLVHVVDAEKADYLPPITFLEKYFDISVEAAERYEAMKNTLAQEDIQLYAANAAVASGKMRQIVSGFIYLDDESDADFLRFDTHRLDALEQLLHEIGGDTLVFYEYAIDKEPVSRVCSQFRNTHCAQIRAMSHGVDGWQHKVNNVVFLQPNWSRDVTEQAYGRVWRTGQTRPVTVWTLIAADTLDEIVVKRVEGNAIWMELFMAHLKKKTGSR